MSFKKGDIVKPNGKFKTTSNIALKHLHKCKVFEVHGYSMRIEVLEGNTKSFDGMTGRYHNLRKDAFMLYDSVEESYSIY